MARKNNVIGIELGVDVTSLKLGLAEANKRIRESEKEFNVASSSMENWTKSIDGVRAKVKQLTDAYKLQELKLRAIQEEYDATVKSQGANSKQATKLKNDLQSQQITVNKLKISLENYEETLEKAEKGEIDLEKATLKNGKAFQQLDKHVDTAKDSTSKLSEGFTVLKGTLANLISNGISAFVSGIKESIANTKELRKEFGMLEAAAKTTGSSFESAQKAMIDVASITEDTGAAVEGVNNLMSAGFDGDALDSLTDELLGASIKFKDTLKFEGLSDGLQETLATGKAIGPFSELLERSGVSLETFDAGLAECNTQAEKQQYVLNQLSKLGLGEVKKEYEEINGSLIDNNRANLENQKAWAGIGEALEPLSTQMLNLKTKGLKALTPAIQAISKTFQKMFSGDFSGAFGDIKKFFNNVRDKIVENLPIIADKIVELLPDIFTMIMNHSINSIKLLIELLPKIVEIIKQVVTGIIEQLPTIIQAITSGLTTYIPLVLEAAQTLFNALIDALPFVIDALSKNLPIIIDNITTFFVENIPVIIEAAIKLFNSLIDALPVVLDSLLAALPGIIEAIMNFLMQSIPALLQGAIDLFMALVKAIPIFLPKLIAAIPKILGTISTELYKMGPKVLELGIELFGQLLGALVELVADMPKAVGDFFKNLKKAFEDIDWGEIGSGILDGILSGIKNVGKKIKETAKDVGKKIKNGFAEFFGINSPSKLMRDEIGEYIGEGVGVGILGSTKKVLKDVDKFSNAISSNVNIGGQVGALAAGTSTSNINFTQIINSTKEPTIKELSRYTNNLLDLNKIKGGLV